jgi:hypothetical protein
LRPPPERVRSGWQEDNGHISAADGLARINEKFKECTNLLDEADLERELNEPRVVFNSSAAGVDEVGRWSFAVDQESRDMSFYVIFRGLEFIESYGVG